ncbi:cytoplasmic membrane protein [hydrothermal vent metagenome]|uniref:Cytoplasmic membrane protein n=1 Tax=hydrothermal vent metagenome TaxID=652676 RepID=A0A1W1EDP3_9ZZZZ
MVYIALFAMAFASATLLPIGSEALLIYDISQDNSILLLWIVATLGNTLGSVFNYWIGLKGEEYLESRSYIDKNKIFKAKSFFEKYGAISLLLSWVPIIGDPLTFIAGVLKYDFKRFLLLVSLAKGARYAIVIFLSYQVGT